MLDIVGDGFDRAACESSAAQLGLGERVAFHGRLPRERGRRAYRRGRRLRLPQLPRARRQRPVRGDGPRAALVVSDRGGPASVVDPTRGVTVTPTDPASTPQALADAVRGLVVDPERRLRMGAAAREYVERDGTWASRVVALEQVFTEIMEVR